MLDIETDYPTTEDFLQGCARCTAQIRESLCDLEYLVKKFATGDYYMTEEDVAKMLRCEVEQIPSMRRYRAVYGRKYLYKKSEVEDFIQKRAIGGK